MQLARFLNGAFKKDGFILENAYSKNFIIGSPKSNKPIKVKILDKKLHYKLLFRPDLYFGEAYTNGDIVIERFRTWMLWNNYSNVQCYICFSKKSV